MTSEFLEFLSCLGERCSVLPETNSGGLSLDDQFYQTKFEKNQIIFHVAPLIKCEEEHERKRHIGNDRSVVIFHSQNQIVDLESFRSKFNHIFVFVQYSQGTEVQYHVRVVAKLNVQMFPPYLQEGHIFSKNTIRKFLLPKLINGERHGLQSVPAFKNPFAKIRWNYLVEVFKSLDVNAEPISVFDQRNF